MTRGGLLGGILVSALVAGSTAAMAGEGVYYPYAGSYPRTHPDRYSYVRNQPYKHYPQSTYRWDPQRQTWYYTGPNWRYWNPGREMSAPIIPAPDYPAVPYGVYVVPR